MDTTKLGKLSDSDVTIAELKSLVDRFVQERSWSNYHSPKNLSMSIAIEAAELMEHFQWTNPEKPDSLMPYDSQVAQELSDVIAYCLALANALNIDVSRSLEFKMERNRLKYPVGSEYQPKGLSSPNSP